MKSELYIKGWRKHCVREVGRCGHCGNKFSGMTFARPYTNAAGHNEMDVICEVCAIKWLGRKAVERLKNAKYGECVYVFPHRRAKKGGKRKCVSVSAYMRRAR